MNVFVFILLLNNTSTNMRQSLQSTCYFLGIVQSTLDIIQYRETHNIIISFTLQNEKLKYKEFLFSILSLWIMVYLIYKNSFFVAF